jgi:hypothetical protein
VEEERRLFIYNRRPPKIYFFISLIPLRSFVATARPHLLNKKVYLLRPETPQAQKKNILEGTLAQELRK